MVRVSIIVPSFNQGIYLNECIQSVLSQDFANWECHIIDDGSNDNTNVEGNRLASLDKRIHYHYRENGGLASARNFGVELANGKYILPLDADDKIGADYLSRALNAFDSNPNLKVVYCKAEYFGAISGEWILPTFSFNNLAKDNCIFCSGLYKKEDWLTVGGYDCNMNKGWEDWEFWISILKNGGEVLQLDYVGFFYRQKNNSMLGSMDSEYKRKAQHYITKKHFDFMIGQLGNPIAISHELDFYKAVYERLKKRVLLDKVRRMRSQLKRVGLGIAIF